MTDSDDGKVTRSIEVGADSAELFAIVADPRRHSELDGSGTVTGNKSGPTELVAGSTFSTKMKMFGVPYRLTSTVTEATPGRTVEWRHPFGHHWRWEFEPTAPGRTKVTETFDYSNRKWYYRGLGFVKSNAKGIEATLAKLRERYPLS